MQTKEGNGIVSGGGWLWNTKGGCHWGIPAEMLGWSYPDVIPYDDIGWQAARCLGARLTGAFIGHEGVG